MNGVKKGLMGRVICVGEPSVPAMERKEWRIIEKAKSDAAIKCFPSID